MLTVGDRELVLRAQAGETAALGLLLERHRATLLAAAQAILRDATAAEDAVQDTSLIALRRIGELRDPGAARAWLLTVLRNVCRMQWRAAASATARGERPDAAGAERSPEDHLDDMANAAWLWTALRRLPEPLRVTVMLRYFGSWSSYGEVADILGVPVGTVRSRLSLARTRLADELRATAAAAHDPRRLPERLEFEAAVADLNAGVSCEPLVAAYHDDVLVELAAGGVHAGKRGLRQTLRGDLESGTRLYLTRVLASDTVTIVEGRLESPPDDPWRCPPSTCQVHYRPAGRTERVRIYFAPRESAGAPASLPR